MLPPDQASVDTRVHTYTAGPSRWVWGTGRAAASGGQQSLGSHVLPAAGLCDRELTSTSEPQRPALGNSGLGGLLSEMPPSLLLQTQHARPGANTATPRSQCLHRGPSTHSSRKGVGWAGGASLRGSNFNRRSKGPGAGTGLACPRNREWVWQEARSWERWAVGQVAQTLSTK